MRAELRYGQIAAYVVCAALVVGALSFTRFTEALEQQSVDWRFVLRGPRPPGDDIVIVAIDEATLSDPALDEPLVFWGEYYASVVRTLTQAGVRAIGLDVVQSIPVDAHAPAGTAPDEELARALYDSGNTVLACIVRTLPDGSQRLITPTEQLTFAAVGGGGRIGFSNVTADNDQVVRGATLAAGAPGEPLLSFPLAVAATAMGEDVRLEERAIRLGERRTPTGAGWRVAINYCGPGRTFRHIPFRELLRPGAADLRGRIALIGFTAVDLQDYHSVPFTRAGTGAYTDLMAGVEVHASILHTLLHGAPLRTLGRPWAWAAAALLLVLSAPVFARAHVAASGAVMLALVGGWLVAGILAFNRGGLILPAVLPTLALVLSFMGTMASRFLVERRSRRHLSELLGRYMSPQVLDYLLDSPQATRLGGEQREVTVLFTDVRGSTALAERLQPQEAVEVLGELLSAMAEAVMAHGGTVDKYTGDGIMAVFNWPVEQPDHADRALRAAVQMRRRWAAHDGQLEFGVGISTGPALLGNIGSPRRMELTAIGDTVNVAARLQELTRELDEAIVAGEETVRRSRGAWRLGSGRPMRLRGRQQPVIAYPVLGPGSSEAHGQNPLDGDER